jgi:hypothetical protein
LHLAIINKLLSSNEFEPAQQQGVFVEKKHQAST